MDASCYACEKPLAPGAGATVSFGMIPLVRVCPECMTSGIDLIQAGAAVARLIMSRVSTQPAEVAPPPNGGAP